MNNSNVFISHHHKDDQHVDKLTSLLKNNGLTIRNSSIRAKPANQRRLDQGLVKVSTIKRLLRMKMKWAGKVVVLIGKETHQRPWVNWEIELAHKLGKPIIGVYERGLKDNVEIPLALQKYSSALIGWDSDTILSAINGTYQFTNPDGSIAPRKDGAHTTC